MPDTAIAAPFVAVERYSTSRLRFAPLSSADPVRVRCQIGVPCPAGSVAGGV